MNKEAQEIFEEIRSMLACSAAAIRGFANGIESANGRTPDYLSTTATLIEVARDRLGRLYEIVGEEDADED